jgi:hypothetical protein
VKALALAVSLMLASAIAGSDPGDPDICRVGFAAPATAAGPADGGPAPAPRHALQDPDRKGLEPAIRPARRGPCIAEPAVMRRDHMTMLSHQRDDTVRAGVRGKPASLKACVECHASADTGSVAAAGFCVSCHAYAAVKIDCFECHASRPAAPAARVADGARR